MQPHRGRVSSAAPSLSPQSRFALDRQSEDADRAEAAVQEQIQKQEQAVSPDGEHETTDFMAQLGRPMACLDVMARLRRLNSNFIFEVSKADASKTGIYIIENRPDPVTGLGTSYKRFVCGMESGYMPEFSVRHWEMDDVPDPDVPGLWHKQKKFTKETRGWRTVLARLIRERLISPALAELYFDIAAGRSSRNWQALTT